MLIISRVNILFLLSGLSVCMLHHGRCAVIGSSVAVVHAVFRCLLLRYQFYCFRHDMIAAVDYLKIFAHVPQVSGHEGFHL